jgi:hypothetical protein
MAQGDGRGGDLRDKGDKGFGFLSCKLNSFSFKRTQSVSLPSPLILNLFISLSFAVKHFEAAYYYGQGAIAGDNEYPGFSNFSLTIRLEVAMRKLLAITALGLMMISCRNDEEIFLREIAQSKEILKNYKDIENYRPKNLAECIAVLDLALDESDKRALRENDLRTYNHSFTVYTRDKWGLWDNSDLSGYFQGIGVAHPDHMAGLIKQSCKRYFLNEPIELNKHLKYIQEEYKNQKEREEKRGGFRSSVTKVVFEYVNLVISLFWIIGIMLLVVIKVVKKKFSTPIVYSTIFSIVYFAGLILYNRLIR